LVLLSLHTMLHRRL